MPKLEERTCNLKTRIEGFKWDLLCFSSDKVCLSQIPTIQEDDFAEIHF